VQKKKEKKKEKKISIYFYFNILYDMLPWKQHT